MQYNNRTILAMIANAINPEGERKVSHTVLSENTLMVYMADGRQFRITVEEAI